MKIRMYNMGFGDCFCLRDRKKSLLVDFGTSNSRIDGRPKKEIFDFVISDLTTIKQKNLLLSNFHIDHISGFLYMMKRRRKSNEFGVIYLPDVFTIAKGSQTIALLLLSDMVKNSYLPNRQVCLLSLVQALCKRPQKVEFLSRGTVFEEKYQALWPDRDVVTQETQKLWERICPAHEEALKILEGFAEKLRMTVCSMADEKEKQSLPLESSLNRELRQMRAQEEFAAFLKDMEQEREALRQFKHKISIVFQNAHDSELNRLFTGDVSQEYMQMISDNYDGRISLYDHYWCIKTPFHGTAQHYFDFQDYTPENLLISNGIHYANSKKQSKELHTCAQYGGLFYINDTHMYCSANDCCDCYQNGCTCKEYDVISPAYYKDI